MSQTWVVELHTGGSCEVTADNLRYDYGCLIFTDTTPVAIFASKQWLTVRAKDAKLLWTPPPTPPPAEEAVFKLPFA